MFFFPIKSNRRLHHTPLVNYALIAANVAIFVATYDGQSTHRAAAYMLVPSDPKLYQYFTYQFLHADWMHLLGNMIFLYVFGNHVEDRLGKFGYLAFYLAGGVLAGVGHSWSSMSPVLGASGSVAAVSGAYLALFPLTDITIFYWLVIYVGAFEVSGLILILFDVGRNILFQFAGYGNVAYLAHLSGYAFGFAVAMLLLWTRLLGREPYDLLAMIEHRRRRSQFRRMTQKGYTAWEHEASQTGKPGKNKPGPHPQEQQIIALRSDIAAALSQHNISQAAELYAQLLALDAGQVMAQDSQLEIANELMSRGRYDLAAQSYELFLNRFTGYTQREQVELILALVYSKYLDRYQRARELLKSALPNLTDPQQKKMAQGMLDQIG